ncbi:hypothetical protein C8J56DRAFT_906341 [Mycena floridula]|nr:hypothetical protein C8J56DRAFT_906341 [Mycena floridula]
MVCIDLKPLGRYREQQTSPHGTCDADVSFPLRPEESSCPRLRREASTTKYPDSLCVPGCAEHQIRPNILTLLRETLEHFRLGPRSIKKTLLRPWGRCPARRSYHLWRYQNVFQIAPSESHLGKLTWSLFTYTSITTLSLGCPNWHMNGSVLPRKCPSRRLQVFGYNDKELQEILGKTSYPLFRCESSVEILCQGVRQWKNSGKLHLSIGFSAHNFGGEMRSSAVKGYAFWGQLNSLYKSDGLCFRVVLEVCKRQIDPVIECDRVHGPLIVKELPYVWARGHLTLLPVSQISSGRGGGVYDF